MIANRTGRLDSLVFGALLLVAFGTAVRSQLLFVSAIVPLSFVVYGRLQSSPSTDLEIDRQLSPRAPLPGDSVSVTTEITNTGSKSVTDIRIVDGVPEELGVDSGTPRLGTSLAPGESDTLCYSVVAQRGTYEFDPATVTAYNLGGSVVLRQTVDDPTELECEIPVDDPPLTTQTLRRSGQRVADTGGSGVEFHTIREYRPTDSPKRIDWRRYARTDELSAIDYRQRRAASVLLLVDTRDESFTRPGTADPTGAQYSAYAAERAFVALATEGHTVGVGFYPDEAYALRFGTGPQHVQEGRQILQKHTALQPSNQQSSGFGSRDPYPAVADGGLGGWLGEDPPDPTEIREKSPVETRILKGLENETQVLVFSPLVDPGLEPLLRRISAYGHDVSVVSPDVTTRDTPGGRVRRHMRDGQIRAIQRRDIRVYDWTVDEPLQLVLEEALRS